MVDAASMQNSERNRQCVLSSDAMTFVMAYVMAYVMAFVTVAIQLHFGLRLMRKG
jgi:hypothetical protein